MLKILAALVLTVALSAKYLLSPVNDPRAAGKVEAYFKHGLNRTIRALAEFEDMVNSRRGKAAMRRSFTKARMAYKEVELLIEYYYPYLVIKINGPALPFVDGENSLAVQEPQGFQVLEEMLFTPSGEAPSAALRKQSTLLRRVLTGIREQADPYNFQDKYIFDAVGFELYRLVSHGISGFDSPVAFHSINEARAVIGSVGTIVNIYLPQLSDSLLSKKLNQQLVSTRQYLADHPDFDRFDRLHFITVFANPLSETIFELKKRLGLLLPGERRILSPLAPHLFATAYFSAAGYSPNEDADATPSKIALGEKLFYDNILSEKRQRSCASCHQPAKAFTDGLAKSIALDGVTRVSRNAPTLLNAAFQPKQFYDSRAVFMEQQVFEVLHNKAEMGGSFQLAAARIRSDSSYSLLVEKAYPATGSLLSGEEITNAIASFLRSLVSLDSRFDRYMNGQQTAMSEAERKGFNLYMGKAKCATCHFVPLFNGVAPPYFGEAESEVLGVPSTTDTIHARVDEDLGKFDLYPVGVLKHAFKTPSLRNIALTGPYMHNGVFQTLDEVIDFYNRGGGAGIGIALPNQTLPTSRLHLTAEEKQQLVAFLHTLTDTSRSKR